MVRVLEYFLIILLIINLLCFTIFLSIVKDALVIRTYTAPNFTISTAGVEFRIPTTYMESHVISVDASKGIIYLSCGNSYIQMVVDISQAISISNILHNLTSARPSTHDLFFKVLSSFGKVEAVTIDRIMNNTYYSTLYVKVGNDVREFDSRPSDAIALALKAGAKIYINSELCPPSITPF
ncbi:MAG: bifunctional nuclease family protein [Candidatus Nanoarchaeia archaeon]|nr:bifunctional nuclease family protein [Candidatus Haiyanarchaeum thermophilum]MCW1303459.1 bifunctional nuclease family protein [Candidatus Haiyanarchaeum thermophilum]MCW1306910.1 bifunctional nuclease family protein [Candidatus Haiyanarchaeum thermophilum]MCW1307528.1 bifunctional nuclease family protein [Candidatus Haiyanarchaeum thermophilum]MCW1308148.1 bifunctional nuclease family protein [Candidatus Haiyanarchaeum thermophilum]